MQDNGSELAVLDGLGIARRLGISPTTAYELLARGEIPAVRVGRQWRVSREALDAFLAGK